jgi:hypothetical protein
MTTPSSGQAQAAFRAINDLLQHPDLLPAPLAAGLAQLRHHLSEQLCRYGTEELEAAKRKLDERFPAFEHYYIRCGATVTWCDRPRQQQPSPRR